MRITTWNVNGLRTTPLNPTLGSLSSDIICIQETKISGASDPHLESLALISGHTSYFSIPKISGYSGVATYTNSRATPIAAGEGLTSDAGGAAIATPLPTSSAGDANDDSQEFVSPGTGYTKETLDMIIEEGRCVITDHGAFVLLNLYIPALTALTRLPFKHSVLCALRAKVEALRAAGRAVILVGDFNICPATIDTAEPIPTKQLLEWQSQPSRTWLHEFMKEGFIDVFRHLHPGKRGAYTCWSTATNARVNNFGVRIDLMLVDKSLLNRVRTVEVLQHVQGSDHCPVRMEIDVEVDVGRVPPSFCTAFMRRFAYRQKTLKDMFRKPKVDAGKACGRDSESAKQYRKELVVAVGEKKERAKRKRTAKPQRIQQAKVSSFFAKKSETIERDDKLAQQEESPPEASDPLQSEKAGSFEAIAQESRHAAKKRREAAKAWKKILTGPPPPPLCRHGERAVLKTVGKSGENRGRTFYSCPYPAGIGKTADCKFFKWAPYKAGLHTDFT